MYTRALTFLILSCSIINCMDKQKSTSRTVQYNSGLTIEYSFSQDAKNTIILSDHLNDANTPLLAMHPSDIGVPVKIIKNTIKQTWGEFFDQSWGNILTYQVKDKPIDNNVLNALKDKFIGTIVLLSHRQNEKNSHQLHVFNINTKNIIRAWYPDLGKPNDVFSENTQHMSAALQNNRTIITVTPKMI